MSIKKIVKLLTNKNIIKIVRVIINHPKFKKIMKSI